jgi:hypothetical protein
MIGHRRVRVIEAGETDHEFSWKTRDDDPKMFSALSVTCVVRWSPYDAGFHHGVGTADGGEHPVLDPGERNPVRSTAG